MMNRSGILLLQIIISRIVDFSMDSIICNACVSIFGLIHSFSLEEIQNMFRKNKINTKSNLGVVIVGINLDV